MHQRLQVDILPQPDDETCGPTSLHAVFRYYGDDVPLESVIASVPRLEAGGTLAVLLGIAAMQRGYAAELYTYDLRMFDPSWFAPPTIDLAEKLRAQLVHKQVSPKFELATHAYLDFLELGGRIHYEGLTPSLLRRHLKRGRPILTGLSATYLYQSRRELDSVEDDLRGEPVGHFVVLAGYDRVQRRVHVADPLHDNPGFDTPYYDVDLQHLIASIFLGVMTYDANLLVISPAQRRSATDAPTS